MPPTHVAHGFPKAAKSACPKLYAFGIRQFGEQTDDSRTVCSSRTHGLDRLRGRESLTARDGNGSSRPRQSLPFQAQHHESGLWLI